MELNSERNIAAYGSSLKLEGEEKKEKNTAETVLDRHVKSVDDINNNTENDLDVAACGHSLKLEESEDKENNVTETVSDGSVIIVDDVNDNTETDFDNPVEISDTDTDLEEVQDKIIGDSVIIIGDSADDREEGKDYDVLSWYSEGENSFDDLEVKGAVKEESKSTVRKYSADSGCFEDVCEQEMAADPLFLIDRNPSTFDSDYFLIKKTATH